MAEPIENTLGSNGQRGIVGLSMSATSSLLLAARNPGFYKAVGSYSGCASTSRPIPYMFASITLQREGISPRQVFGPMGGSYNTEHDALVKAEGLRGSAIYVSNATGLMSQNETFNQAFFLSLLEAAAMGGIQAGLGFHILRMRPRDPEILEMDWRRYVGGMN